MFSNRLYSPLRYPGGKAPFAPFIAKLMEVNGVAGGHYLEPYAGGAGVALAVADEVEVALEVELRRAQLDPAAAPAGRAPRPARASMPAMTFTPLPKGCLPIASCANKNLNLPSAAMSARCWQRSMPGRPRPASPAMAGGLW